MLAKFTNKGDAPHIIFDMGKVQRTVRPGQTVEVDLEPYAVRQYMRAMDRPKAPRVEPIDKFPPDAELELPRSVKPNMHINQPPRAVSAQGRQRPASPAPVPEAVPARDTPLANRRTKYEPEPEPVVKPEPATPAELLDRIGEFSEDDRIRLAHKLLPKDALPMRPKPNQIMAALRKHSKEE